MCSEVQNECVQQTPRSKVNATRGFTHAHFTTFLSRSRCGGPAKEVSCSMKSHRIGQYGNL